MVVIIVVGKKSKAAANSIPKPVDQVRNFLKIGEIIHVLVNEIDHRDSQIIIFLTAND